MAAPLPTFAPHDDDASYTRKLNELVSAFDRRLRALERTLATYAVTNNASPSRSLDVSAATLAETRVVLGTLIEDFKTGGRLG